MIVVVEVLVCGIESRDMARVFPVVRDAVGLYGDTAAKVQVPARAQDAWQLVGSVAVGGVGGYYGYAEVLVFILIDGNGEVDGARIERWRNFSLSDEVPGICLRKGDVIVELESRLGKQARR